MSHSQIDIIISSCSFIKRGFKLHTLADVLLHSGKELPLEFQAMLCCRYRLHGQVYGDIEPANILICEMR